MKTTIIKLHIAAIIVLYPTFSFVHGGEDHVKKSKQKVQVLKKKKTDTRK